MDPQSFENLTVGLSNTVIKEAAKQAYLNKSGGVVSTLNNDAAERFANSFTELFSDLFVANLAKFIVNLIESASIVGTIVTEPVVQGSPATAVMMPISGEKPDVNNLKIKCI